MTTTPAVAPSHHPSLEPISAAERDGAPLPEERPGWRGRTGCVGYVTKMFPRISETFILDEILALKRHGIPVKIYSLLPPDRDARVHPAAAALMADVELLCPPGRQRVPRLLANAFACFRVRPTGTIKHVLRALISAHPRRSLPRLERALALAHRLRRDRVAHVHAAWAHAPASAVRIASRLTGIPWSLGAHAKDIHLSEPASLTKKIGAARLTIACSAANRELLAALAPADAAGGRDAEVMLIHHGVDAEYFTPAPDGGARRPSSPTPVILSVGRLVPKKGFPVLLEAAAILDERGLPFQLEIVGAGPERGHLEQRIAALGLRHRVVLRGIAVREEIRAYYQRASCFALACRVTDDGDRDGVPNTLAEAMASGLPVVSTRLPGVEEIVRDGETGRIVPPDDPQALAGALAELLEQPDRARELGARARAWIVGHFDARANGDRRARRLRRTLGIERVLYVSADRGVPVRGHKGASVHVRSVVEALMRAGVDTRILTSRAGPADGVAPASRLIEVRSSPACRRIVRWLARWTRGGKPLERAVLRLLDNLWILAAARRVAATWRPDVVYERYALTAVAGAWLARYLRVPFILEVNAPLAQEEQTFRELRLGLLARWAERWLLRRADRVVVVSWALHAHALRNGARHERILVLPNAVDPELYLRHDRADAIRSAWQLEDRFAVGFCGSLKPWHGVQRLLEAAARAVPAVPNLCLLIVGDGPERGALERRARELGIADRVRFTGAVPHAEVPMHLAACDTLAAPYEPVAGFYFSPLKVAEYAAAGRPVIAAATGEIPRALAGVEGVTWTEPGDTESLVRALARCAGADPERLRRHGGTAPAWTWNDVVGRTLAAAEEVRRIQWAWRGEPEPPAVACLVERFPAGVDDSVVNRLLTLEREGHRVVVFALEQSAEAYPAEGLERLSVSARIVRGPGGIGVRARLAGHALLLLRSPLAYVAAAGRAIRDAGRRGPAWFAPAPAIARVMRRHGVRRLIAGPGARALAQAEVVSRLTGIAIERVDIPGTDGRAPRECRA